MKNSSQIIGSNLVKRGRQKLDLRRERLGHSDFEYWKEVLLCVHELCTYMTDCVA